MADWKVDRTVSMGNIIAAVLLLATFAGFYMNQDRRITVVEQQTHSLTADIVRMLEDQMERDASQDIGVQQFRSEMRVDVRDMNGKLDRLVERMLQ